MKKIPLILSLSFLFLLCQSELPLIKIYLIGDSTMANKAPDKYPETGWGQVFHTFFNNRVQISNHARNGRSSKSFIGEGLWKNVYDSLQSGDYLLIQFGHNDQKKCDSTRYTAPFGEYQSNLKRYISESKAKGAIPVLLTPVMRRRFDENGSFYDTHGDYPAAVREVAKELNITLIDHHQLSKELIVDYGEERSKELFLWLKPGENENYPDGNHDNTHFSKQGALFMAQLVADAISKKDIVLKNYLLKRD